MEFLSEEEVSRLIVKVRDKDDEAFSELVSRYTPMINKVISGFHGASFRSDEAFAEACVVLYRAALSYDLSSKGVTFGLYARICIYRRMCDIVGSGSGVEFLDEADVDSLAVANAVEAGLVGRETMKVSIARAKEILSEYEFKVFLLYLKGYGTASIAEQLSKTPKSVDNAKARLMKRLREESSSFPLFD